MFGDTDTVNVPNPFSPASTVVIFVLYHIVFIYIMYIEGRLEIVL